MDIVNIIKLFNMRDTELRDTILKYLDKSQNYLDKLLDDIQYTKLLKFISIDTYNFNIYNS